MSNDNYAELAEWAENDMTLKPHSTTARRGEDAAAAGRALLERAGGRPSLSEGAGESPRRQVRLSHAVSDAVDRIAAHQHRSASEVMRDAVEEYVSSHRV